MINPEDEIHIDFQTSVTKEGAAARMLGWMQGPIQPKYIQVTENGISADQLTALSSMDGSLKERLLELRETARLAFIDSAERGDSIFITQEKQEAVEQCEEQIKKAASYLVDLEDEIAKGDYSDLKIDRHRTDKTGTIHITLKSLDQWARKNHGISILDQSPKPLTENPSTQPESQQENKPESGQTKLEHLFTTFAFLVEAFAKNANALKHDDDRPNASAIASRLEQLAKEANKQQVLPGQSAYAIRKRIKEAMRIKQSKLPKA